MATFKSKTTVDDRTTIVEYIAVDLRTKNGTYRVTTNEYDKSLRLRRTDRAHYISDSLYIEPQHLDAVIDLLTVARERTKRGAL